MRFDLLGKAVRRFRLPTVDYVNAPVIIIPVQEGDVNSRYFEITLYDDHGDMDLSVYSKAMLSGTTPSGIVLTSSKCEFSEDKKTVIVQFSGGFTAQAGRVACDILFTNADNTVALTSQRFYVIVSESQSGKVITENEENYNELLSLLKEVGDLENNLVTAEDDRVKAETARVTAEKKRVNTEKARVDAEDARVDQETTRQTNEETRKTNETNRETAERERATAEAARITAESARAAAEQDRATTETGRAVAETARENNETSRQTAETQRATAESARVAAETQRETDFQEAKEACEDATQEANNAAQNVQDLLDALPCPTNKVDGEVTTSLVGLNFVALED